MMIYLLITVACTIKEPAKTFNLTCKPQVERFYMTEAECKAQENMDGKSSTCINVKVK